MDVPKSIPFRRSRRRKPKPLPYAVRMMIARQIFFEGLSMQQAAMDNGISLTYAWRIKQEFIEVVWRWVGPSTEDKSKLERRIRTLSSRSHK